MRTFKTVGSGQCLCGGLEANLRHALRIGVDDREGGIPPLGVLAPHTRLRLHTAYPQPVRFGEYQSRHGVHAQGELYTCVRQRNSSVTKPKPRKYFYFSNIKNKWDLHSHARMPSACKTGSASGCWLRDRAESRACRGSGVRTKMHWHSAAPVVLELRLLGVRREHHR